jgi:hypothetical protein
MPRARLLLLLACTAGVLAGARGARAESALVLAYPEVFGSVPAATYDEAGNRLGHARLQVERRDDGGVRLVSESGIDGGASTLATAELAPLGDGRGLRLEVEESRSFDPTGTPMGVLRIDHREGFATCTAGDGTAVDRLELPAEDRIANVPFNLLFLPLVRGDADSLSFDFMLCRGGARTLGFEAHVARRDGSDGLVEIRYGPRFGKMVSLLSQRLVPRLSFWFDPGARDPWLAHRLPLYAKGPEVLVVRDGVPTTLLSDAEAVSETP